MGHFAAHAARPPLQKNSYTPCVVLLTTVVGFFRGMHVCVFVRGMHLFLCVACMFFLCVACIFFVRGMHVFCLPSTSMAMRKLEHC